MKLFYGAHPIQSPHHSVPLSALDLSLLLYQSQLSYASLPLLINTSRKDLIFSSLHEIYGLKMDGNVLWCDCFIIRRMYLVDFSLSCSIIIFNFFLEMGCQTFVMTMWRAFWISDISDSNILDKYLDHFEQVSSIYELILFKCRCSLSF